MKAEELINDLIDRVKGTMNDAEKLKTLSDAELNQRPNEGAWSALEAIQHLNRYGDFYTPEIRKRIKESRLAKSDAFKTGVLGDYFAKSVAPKEKLNKMKTFKNMNPAGSKLDRTVLDDFIFHQQQMLELLKEARNTNLTKVKTTITISKIIKLRLGDTFRVVIYHNQRHLVQALKAVRIKN
ncbi:MAG: DinB family protein [Crocinitomicaceae bacterium]|nr:DinB family protein [Crocinitomicaceae bacterium]